MFTALTQAMLLPSNKPKPSEEHFTTPKTTLYGWKPQGGLWTSTYTFSDKVSAWHDYNSIEEVKSGEFQVWLADIEPGTNIYQLDSLAAIEIAHTKWTLDMDAVNGRTPSFIPDIRIDYTKAMQDGIDAFHMTPAGLDAIRFTDYYMLGADWSCESTVWLRWCLTNIHKGPTVTVP